MKKNDRYFQIRIEGNSFERGFQYGKQTKDLIQISISNYSEMFEVFSGLSWSAARAMSEKYIYPVEKYSPELLEEMKGIAEGSGLLFEDIFTLNCRSEIVLDNTVDGCTAFGISKNIASDGKTHICQNWDWIRRQKDALIVIEIVKSDSFPSILMIAEAGIISGKGMNSAGLGTCFNALSTGKGQPGVPIHILLRKILDSSTLGDAVEAIATADRASSGNFLIGTAEGEIINIESAPEDFGVLYAERGYLAHTNHFLCQNLICKLFDHGKVILPDTFHRLGRINSLLGVNNNSLNFDKCTDFLSDHINHPDSICRHEDSKDPEGKQLASVYSVIMDLCEHALWITDTNPCESSFSKYSFAQDKS